MLCHAGDEFESAQSWVVHFGQLATKYQTASSLQFQIVPRLLASLRERLQQARENRYPWRTEAVSLALGRRQFRVGAQLLFRFLVLWRLLLDHPAHEDCASDFPHLLREHAERLEDGVVKLRVRTLVGALGRSLLPRARAPHRHVVLRPSRLRFDVCSSPFLPLSRIFCQRSLPQAPTEV